MPAGRGKKGAQPCCKRKNAQPIAEHVNRISTKNDNDSKSLQVISWSNNMLNISVDSPPCTTSCTQFVSPGQSFADPGTSYMVSSPYPSPYYSWYETAPITPPMAEGMSPFILTKIAGNISKCDGCGNKYSKPLLPPYDLCVQHREWRTFSDASGLPQLKFAPAYYHVNLPCIHRNWPFFTPRELIVSTELWSKLSTTHKEFLGGFWISEVTVLCDCFSYSNPSYPKQFLHGLCDTFRPIPVKRALIIMIFLCAFKG